MENIASNFQEEVECKEAKAFYAMQNAVESIHNETYSLMIETAIRNDDEKTKLFDAIRHCPEIRKMAAWAKYWMDKRFDLRVRIFANACFEGVFFSASFLALIWLGNKNKLEGFTQANEWIARDERLHFDFALALLKSKYRMPVNRQWKRFIRNIVMSAFDILVEFIERALKVKLIGLDSNDMIEYSKMCFNYATNYLGYGEFFENPSPPDWMIRMGMNNKTNFFEKKVTEYSKVKNQTYTFEILPKF
jgi:ribonucleoside-diphosphate reductase beta chain